MKSVRYNMLSQAPGAFRRQTGAVTMFSAVLILILLTEVVLYATQVGVFEQRKSGNDMRQKQAFHAAEAGIQSAKEYFLQNALRVAFPGDTGWLESGAARWVECPDNPASLSPRHPCSAESLRDVPEVYGSSYFFCQPGEDCSAVGEAPGPSLVPVTDYLSIGISDPSHPNYATSYAATSRVEVQALLCVLDIDRTKAGTGEPVVQGCKEPTLAAGDHLYYVLTLLARGQADCGDVADPASCSAEVLIAEKVGSFGPTAGDGGPNVPLTARSTFPPGGTAELVPNPNGGGIGVPVSAWLNGRTAGNLCPSQTVATDPLDGTGGSWATCESHEWYGVDALPDDFACPPGGSCKCGSTERTLSYSKGNDPVIGIDIVIDEEFPCSLFEATFGVEETVGNFWTLANSMGRVIDSCQGLGPDSAGPYWVVGPLCRINANTVVGSKDFPVFLVSAAATTEIRGGAEIWGVFYATNILNANATVAVNGTATIYGAAVIDSTIDKFNGTFQIVYVDQVVDLASNTGGLGKVAGGWTDFHQYWR